MRKVAAPAALHLKANLLPRLVACFRSQKPSSVVFLFYRCCHDMSFGDIVQFDSYSLRFVRMAFVFISSNVCIGRLRRRPQLATRVKNILRSDLYQCTYGVKDEALARKKRERKQERQRRGGIRRRSWRAGASGRNGAPGWGGPPSCESGEANAGFRSSPESAPLLCSWKKGLVDRAAGK